MTWIDTHCHLQLDERPPEDLLERAPEVDWVVVPGVDLPTSQAAYELSQRFPGRILATAGLHPHEAEHWVAQAEGIVDLAQRVAAVGETGLDFYRTFSPQAAQEHAFRSQLELAKELGKPCVIHCRDAFAQVYDILERHALGDRAILHCWTGGRKWTKRFLTLDCWFSFAGPVAFETGETIRLAAALIPPDRALVETDTPFLSPPPFRGELNEPGRVALVGAALGQVWGMSSMEVAAITSANAAKVFGS